ncbi:MAG: hypothetical protein VR71_11975 [Roseovarius sp. BRH_c41]|nr:MAG: hypothetical protein VR71_11975 [Roseovarius sp. BRH_c41]
MLLAHYSGIKSVSAEPVGKLDYAELGAISPFRVFAVAHHVLGHYPPEHPASIGPCPEGTYRLAPQHIATQHQRICGRLLISVRANLPDWLEGSFTEVCID